MQVTLARNTTRRRKIFKLSESYETKKMRGMLSKTEWLKMEIKISRIVISLDRNYLQKAKHERKQSFFS